MPKKRSRKKEQEEELDDRLFRNCFALHPPDKDYPLDNLEDFRAYYAEVELADKKQRQAGFDIGLKRLSYDKSRNPVYAIETLLIAHETGLYPPIWALDFLYDSFLDYHNNQGEKSLDKCLGLARGKGQCPAFKEVHNHDRDETLMLHVGRLQILFSCTVDEACYMVARMIEELPEEKVQYVKMLSFETIRDRYYDGKWKYIVGPENKHTVKALMKWSDEEKVEYLRMYPEDSLPRKL